MSYWGNTFMPALVGMVNPVIKELARFTDYTEEQLREIWWEHAEKALAEAEGDVVKYVDELCEQLKVFLIVTLEQDW